MFSRVFPEELRDIKTAKSSLDASPVDDEHNILRAG